MNSKNSTIIRCPLGCISNVKENGWGNFRCRKCDCCFKITYLPNCKHEIEFWQSSDCAFRCVKCGDEHEPDKK